MTLVLKKKGDRFLIQGQLLQINIPSIYKKIPRLGGWNKQRLSSRICTKRSGL